MAERKPAEKDTEKPAKSTTARGKKSKGFSAEERAAMKERAQELKAEANKADGEKALLAKIAGCVWSQTGDPLRTPVAFGEELVVPVHPIPPELLVLVGLIGQPCRERCGGLFQGA